jgi:hypothetical protein
LGIIATPTQRIASCVLEIGSIDHLTFPEKSRAVAGRGFSVV